MKRKLRTQMIISGDLKNIFRITTPFSYVKSGTPVELLSVKINPAYDSGCEARIKLSHNGLTRAISVDPAILKK